MAQALAADQIFEKLSPSVWTVVSFDARSRTQAQGSAVVVAPGRVVTNCHVVDKGAGFAVQRENVSYGATLEWQDPDRDLCQLKVSDFSAPPVELAGSGSLKVGSRVYAIGSPQGYEMTLSDGLISALRRGDDGELVHIQTTTPISPGSSGGGLFDAEGRLVGITTSGARDSQNLNFAVPAMLIAELPARSRRRDELQRERSAAAPAASQAGFVAGTRRAGDWFEYRVTDTVTRSARTFTLSVERVAGGRVIYGGGARIEDASGQWVERDGGGLGELDALTPPGGWGYIARQGATRPLAFSSRLPSGHPTRFDLTATVGGDERIRIGIRDYEAIRVDLKGWSDRPSHISGMAQTVLSPYRATVWFSQELERVVKFTFTIRHPGETLELVDAGNR